MSAAFQYYHLLPSLDGFASFVKQKACSPSDRQCQKAAESLLSATSVDIDFDAISHAVVVNAFWAEGPERGAWSETIQAYSPTDSIEVGILNNEKVDEPEEMSLGGYLTVLGEDSKLSKWSLSTYSDDFRN